MGGIMQNLNLSRRIGKFAGDRRAIGWLIVISLGFAGYMWLKQNPQHNPLAPLDVRNPPGLATGLKLAEITTDRGQCRAALTRSGIAFRNLIPTGEGPCSLTDRTQMTGAPMSPARPISTCPVAVGLQIWLSHGLQQAAQTHLGTKVTRIEHIGTNSCRRINGGRTGPWSEHAHGNAIDIRAFVLSDGRRVSILQDWGKGEKGDFLKAARDAACDSFRTVLSPDYNAKHANHFHLDQGTRWSSACR